MTKKPSGKDILPWTFTKLTTYESCPAKAKYKFIDKIMVPEKDVFAKGNAIHSALERCVKGELTLAEVRKVFTGFGARLSEEPMKFVKVLKADYEKNPECFSVEDNIGIDKKWFELPDWFDKKCWGRIKCDVVQDRGNIVEVVDYKTGRMYPEHVDQGVVYTAALCGMYPDAEFLQATHVYLEHNTITTKLYSQEDMLKSREELVVRLKVMEKEKKFAPKCSADACKWCEYHCKRGGPCREGF